MDLNETSFRGRHDIQFCFRVFRRELNFRGASITCGIRAKAGVSRIFIIRVDSISSPPQNILKPILASVVGSRVGKPCGQSNAQWYRS